MTMRKARVLVIERQVSMMIRLLAFFEARPDIEVVEANQNVKAFIDNASPTELHALMDALRPDAVIVDPREPVHSDLLWISKLQEIAFAPIIAFTDCEAGDGRLRGFRFYDVVRRPVDATLPALRLLAFAVRRAKLEQELLTMPKPKSPRHIVSGVGLVAIGASAGGTEAILEIVSALPPDFPPIVIVQHITKGFAEVFARHIDRRSALSATVASDGEAALCGHVYVAPDERHLTVEKRPHGYALRCRAGEKVMGHMPSVDALFGSAAAAAGARAVGVLLTGMGRDGARGLKRMRDAGAFTIGQDEQSSLVYGMPRAAWELGAVCARLPLDGIAGELIKRVRKGE